jgi:hypothetical protein
MVLHARTDRFFLQIGGFLQWRAENHSEWNQIIKLFSNNQNSFPHRAGIAPSALFGYNQGL